MTGVAPLKQRGFALGRGWNENSTMKDDGVGPSGDALEHLQCPQPSPWEGLGLRGSVEHLQCPQPPRDAFNPGAVEHFQCPQSARG